MGVTIHFEGRLKSEEDFLQVMSKAQAFADKYNFEFISINKNSKSLSRVTDDEEWNYVGPVKGARLIIAELAEPVWLEFDATLYLQDFCKTQFADISAHIILVEFLRELMTHFQEFDVFDEGEFWETNNRALLIQQRAAFFEALMEAQHQNPTLQAGPFKTLEGRILDAIEE